MSWEEVKKSTESLTKSFEDFKKENDVRLNSLAQGKSVTELDAKLAKHDASFTEMEKKFEAAVAAMKRTGREIEVSTGEAEREAKELARELYSKGELSSEKSARFNELNGPEYKLLSVQNDNDGGYAVRPTVSNNIQKKIFESSPMRALADVMTIGSDAWEELYDNDQPTSGWVGETQSRTETSTNKLNKIRIPVHELYAEPRATQKILDDSFFDIESWHQNKVIEKFARDEASAFISGDGLLKPKGILSYAAGDDFDKLEQVASGGASTLTADGLLNLQNALLEDFQANASWLMARATAGAVRLLKDNQNRYLFSIDPQAGLNGAQPFLLLGKPLYYASDMPAVTSNSLSVAYGDYRQGYKIVDRVGIRVLRDALTLKGFVKFYTTKRVGGGVQKFQAIKILKTATTL